MQLNELFAEYRLYARAMGRSPNTVTSMQYQVRRLVLYIDHVSQSADSADITPRRLREFIDASRQAYAPKTVANNVRAIKTLFTFGVTDGLINDNPAEKLSIPKVPVRDFDIFESRDIERLLKACDTGRLTGVRDQAIITILYDSGLRAAELVGLHDHDIDWEIGLLHVIGRGDRQRLVPVSLRTLRVIRGYIIRRDAEFPNTAQRLFCNQSGLPLSTSGLLQLLERLGGRTGLHVHPHKYRHSFAVQTLRNGARELDNQASLGHTTLMMTRHYARQSGVDLAEAHRRFSPVDHLRG